MDSLVTSFEELALKAGYTKRMSEESIDKLNDAVKEMVDLQEMIKAGSHSEEVKQEVFNITSRAMNSLDAVYKNLNTLESLS